MIAYIHSYTPNINHRQRSEDERGANRQAGGWAMGKWLEEQERPLGEQEQTFKK